MGSHGMTEFDRPRAVQSARHISLDVRELMDRGLEPFDRIMRTLESLPQDGVLRVIGRFRRVPLCSMMRMGGWQPWGERTSDGYLIWFFRTPDRTGIA
jgi:hypothetical protein